MPHYLSKARRANAAAARLFNNIKNSQHWILDVVFKEDECKIYAEDGARNLASMRRILLNMVKEHPFKDSVAGKFQRANWDLKFREEILFGQKLRKV